MQGSRQRHGSDSRHALVCGRFEILGPPHRDGGIEWCDALDTIEQRRVVLKSTSVVGPEAGPERSRLVHEFALLSTASHPSIPRALDFIAADSGRSHVSLQDNEGFVQLLRWAESGPSLDEFIPWFDSLLSALEYLHGLGLVHTDLGPSTVLVSDQGSGRPTPSIRLTGFHRSQWYATASAAPRKRRGFFLPSENAQSSALGPRVDLYSAAALAACVLRGVGEGDAKDLRSPDVLLSDGGDRIPEPLNAVLRRMTASDESLRPSSVHDVRRQLDDTPFRGLGSGPLTVRTGRECGVVPRAALTSLVSAGCSEASIRGAHMVVVVGAAGSGKTTLAKQLRVESLIRGYEYSLCTQAVGRSGTTCLSDAFRLESMRIASHGDAPASAGSPDSAPHKCRGSAPSAGAGSTAPSRVVCFADNIDRLADDDLDSLLEMARAATHAPDSVLIVATCREVPVGLLHGEAVRLRGEVQSTGGAGSSELAVDVRPLSMFTLDEAERFIAEMTCARPTAGLASWILRRSGGHPLFAQELVRYLAKQDCLLRTPDGLDMVAGGGADLGVPHSLSAALEDRLRTLSDDEMRLAGVVSLGPGVTPEVVSGVMSLTDENAGRVLGRLTEAGLLGAATAGGDITFTHGLLRDAVYDRLPGARRQSLHRSVAEMWEETPRGECAPSHR